MCRKVEEIKLVLLFSNQHLFIGVLLVQQSEPYLLLLSQHQKNLYVGRVVALPLHTPVPTTASLLIASSDNTSTTDGSAHCAAALSVPLQDKTVVNSSHPSCQLTPLSFSSSTSRDQIREGSAKCV